MVSADLRSSSGVVQTKMECPPPVAAVMVHVDLDHDCKSSMEVAMGLADRFQATLIGVAGCATWPAFMAGDIGLTPSNQYDFQKIMARFAQRGEKFRAQGRWLKQVEWRSMLEPPAELLLREARAADLLVIGRRRSGDEHDPGVILLRAGRPILLVPDNARLLEFRRVVVAWKIRGNAAAPCRTRSPCCRRPKRCCSPKSVSMKGSRSRRRLWRMWRHISCATGLSLQTKHGARQGGRSRPSSFNSWQMRRRT